MRAAFKFTIILAIFLSPGTVLAQDQQSTGEFSLQTQQQQYSNNGKWQYHFIPYIWFSGIEGDVAVRGIPVHVDESFADLAENLDFGFQFHFEARKDKWGYYIDPTYINLSADASSNGTSADADLTQWLVDFGGIRQLWSKCRGNEGQMSSIDLLFGGRYWNMNTDLDVSGVGRFSDDESWIDPIIGARYTTDFSKSWGFITRYDIGGFGVGSDFTWNLLLLLSYRTSQSGRLLFGYRILDVDRENGSGADFFKYDVTYKGPILGYSFSF